MATIAQPQTIARPAVHKETGLWSWITTVDHKRIGILYGVTAIILFLVGGIEALMIRTQLIKANNDFVSPTTYNQLFTMHGTTMIFLVIMPMSVAFFNLIMPLQIGARDVAFPRLNAFSYWTFLAAAIIINMSWLFNSAPDGGWYGYAPNTELYFNPGRNIDFWMFGLQVAGVASMAGAFNFIVTILNLRAPGMSMMRMPIFTWATFITSILIVLAFPVITVALILLGFDRYAGTHFFLAQAYSQQAGVWVATGGDPLLWQHLFWIFGHPEVYILILPAFGIVSEILPVFSRKPLFGYAVMVYALAAIAFLAFVVWAHHMFTTGLGATADSVFSASTMLIAIPTGVKIFNWLGTMFFGQIKFSTACLFAIGLVSQFTIGGISGVMHASPPVDTQHNDSYFVVAHFHYVLFGGSMFAIFGAIYFWFPKFTNRLLSEKLGKWHFWLMLLGFNMTFFPMHFLGLEGMPRRYYTYGSDSGWGLWNLVCTIGSYILAFSVALFIVNVFYSLRRGQISGADPWDGATLEWAIPSPPPAYNFATIPTVTHRDELWWRKYGEGLGHPEESRVLATVAGHEIGQAQVPDESPQREAQRRIASEDVEPGHIHMPNPSYYPIIASIGIFIAACGMIWDEHTINIQLLHLPVLVVIGVLVFLWGVYGWAFEPAG